MSPVSLADPLRLCYARVYPSTMPTQTTPSTDPKLYTNEEQEGIALHLNDQYRKALEEEHGTDRLTAKTKDVLRESAPLVANELIYIALHGSKESVRLNACKEILARVLGPTSNPSAQAGDTFAELLLKVSSRQD